MSDEHFGCNGSTIRTLSGVYFDLANSTPKMVRLHDISSALSKICRFGGQVGEFYSVAQHSVLCSRVAKYQFGASDEGAFAVLMHDAAEAYIGDVVKPLKVLLSPNIERIESAIEAAIAERYCIDFKKHHALIKRIDRAMLIAERNHLFSKDHVKWTGEDEVEKIDVTIVGWPPEVAGPLFKATFDELY